MQTTADELFAVSLQGDHRNVQISHLFHMDACVMIKPPGLIIDHRVSAGTTIKMPHETKRGKIQN